MAKTTTSHPPVVRTSAGLRGAIFDEIDAIRAGQSNPTRANAIAKLATGVIDSVRMELEVSKHLRSIPKDEAEVVGERFSKGLLANSAFPLA